MAVSLSASSSAFKNGTCPLDSCLTDEPGRWAALVWDNCYPDCLVQSLCYNFTVTHFPVTMLPNKSSFYFGCYFFFNVTGLCLLS